MAEESRHGRLPEGWTKQSLTVPRSVWTGMRLLSEVHGYGSLKSLGTVGLGIVAGMPQHMRKRMLKWIAQAEVDGHEAIDPEAIWRELLGAIADDFGNARVVGTVTPVRPGEMPLPTPQTHAVTRILDPNVTLPPDQRPGQEASAPKRKAGGA